MPFNFSKTESSKSSNYSATDSPHFNHATHAALLTAVGIHFDNRTPTVIARDAGKHSPLPALERETNYIISHHDTLEMGSMLVWDFPTGFDAQQAIKVSVVTYYRKTPSGALTDPSCQLGSMTTWTSCTGRTLPWDTDMMSLRDAAFRAA